MKIAISTTGPNVDSTVDPRFGRAKYFVIYDSDSGESTVIDNAVNLNAVQGAGIQSAKNTVDAGVGCVITGNVGPKAYSVLSSAGIKVCIGASGTAKDAVEAWKNGTLNETGKANVEGHWM